MSSSQSPFNTYPKRPFTGSCLCGQIRYVVFLRLPHENSSSASSESSDHESSSHIITRPPTSERTPSEGPLPNGLYRCNCTTCHKMGHFHLRLEDRWEDFYLLSPLPTQEMVDESNYKEGDTSGGINGLKEQIGDWTGMAHFNFCKKCGVAIFIFNGCGKLNKITWDGEDLVWPGLRTPQPIAGKPSSVSSSPPKLNKGDQITVWQPAKSSDFPGNQRKSELEYFSVNCLTIDDQVGLGLKGFQERKEVGYIEGKNGFKYTWEEGPGEGGVW